MQTNETRHSFVCGFEDRVANCDIGEWHRFLSVCHSPTDRESSASLDNFFWVYFDLKQVVGLSSDVEVTNGMKCRKVNRMRECAEANDRI